MTLPSVIQGDWACCLILLGCVLASSLGARSWLLLAAVDALPRLVAALFHFADLHVSE